MPIPSADEMRNSIRQKLECMFQALLSANESISVVEGLCPNVRTVKLDFDDCVEDLLKTFFTDLCNALSREFSQGTPATIDIDWTRFTEESESSTRARSRRHRYEEEPDSERGASAIEELVNAIQFEKIAGDLEQQAATLQQEGKAILANGLVSFLGLTLPRSSFKIKSGRICVDIYSADYWHRYEAVRDYSKFEDGLRDARLETEMDFGCAVSFLKSAVMEMTYDEQEIPSRTTFGKGEALEIVCFKSKYEFRFTRPAFDAMSAYVTLHGNESSVAAVNKLLDEISNQKAA